MGQKAVAGGLSAFQFELFSLLGRTARPQKQFCFFLGGGSGYIYCPIAWGHSEHCCREGGSSVLTVNADEVRRNDEVKGINQKKSSEVSVFSKIALQ
jgi:hypothetical protein